MELTEDKKNDLKNYLAAEELSKDRIHIFENMCVHILAFNYLKKCKLEFIIYRLATFCSEHRDRDCVFEFDVSESIIKLIAKDFLTKETIKTIDFHRGNWGRENIDEVMPRTELWLLWIKKNHGQLALVVTPLRKLDDKND